MKLRAEQPHETVAAFLEQLEEEIVPGYDALTVSSARELSSGIYGQETNRVAVDTVRDISIVGPDGDDLPLRVYAPEGNGHPVVLWVHGGGFTLGGIDTHDPTCRRLVDHLDCVIVSVDYRLAPEHEFPAGLQDVYCAAKWIKSNAEEIRADPTRFAIGGQSAGGNLAAATTHLARDRDEEMFEYQVLIYPITDHNFDTVSYRKNAEGYYLTREKMKWFWNNYLPHEIDGANPYVSPLRAHDFSDLPPATVITAGFDPICSEGVQYAEKLEEAGVPVNAINYEDMIHAFFVMYDDGPPQTREAMEEIRRDLASVFDLE